MSKYILRRILSMVLVLSLLLHSPFSLQRQFLEVHSQKKKAVPDVVLQRLNEKYHFNDPLWKQYLSYMGDLIKGDLGPSFRYDALTVNDIIAKGFPVSAMLGFLRCYCQLYLEYQQELLLPIDKTDGRIIQ